MSRPSDHIDSARPDSAGPGEEVNAPALGVRGWLRWFWRQLTSMRTALFLLLLLAIAAVPGSLVPQRSSDPNGVVQYRRDYPELYPVVDAVQGFDVYTSVWFSSIYLLLFLSLIGCVVPRTVHHWRALRAKPPRTPSRLDRIEDSEVQDVAGGPGVEAALAEGEALLRRGRYRIERYGDSLSAERGYLRETGNLVFHGALVGILATVAIAGGFGYSGQKIVVEGESFVNYVGGYDSYNPGRFVTQDSLDAYRLTLDDLDATYEQQNPNAFGLALDYTASVTTEQPGGEDVDEQTIKVNSPLGIDGTNVYLLGNGYAPRITVRDGEGNIALTGSIPFLPQDTNLTSTGVIKVPDALPTQIGMVGFLYPTAAQLTTGAFTSIYPGLGDPLLSLSVYTGDLGLDAGIPRNVYELDVEDMTQVAGRGTDVAAVQLRIGDTVTLPDGLGSITLDGIDRFASLDIHHDPTQGGVFLFAMLVLLGLLTSLFVPRRRLWLRVTETSGGLHLEYAGLARGDDPGLPAAVSEFARQHQEKLGSAAPRLDA